MLPIIFAVAAALAAPATTAAHDLPPTVPPAAEIAPEFRLKGKVVALPFVMVREFPFVEAEVSGVKGKLMLDSGTLEALTLNQNPLELPEGRVVGQGRFGSGQSYQKVLRPSVDHVRLAGGMSFDRVSTFLSQNAAQLEHITPDFLGWIGYGFWQGYAVKLDYKASRATFYKRGPAVFLKGETVIAAIPFTTPRLPNHPVLTARMGDMEVVVILDTGQYGNLFADTATLQQLEASKDIEPVPGDDQPVNVKALRFSRGPAIALAKLATHPIAAAAPFAKAIGVDSPRIVTLGYVFLKQYKTVWDYPHKTLYLLKP